MAGRITADSLGELLARHELAVLARRACAAQAEPWRPRGSAWRGPDKSSSCKRALPTPGRSAERRTVAVGAGDAEQEAYGADLARLQRAVADVEASAIALPSSSVHLQVNPSLIIVELSWHLAEAVALERALDGPPQRGSELAMVWRAPRTARTRVARASDGDLLVAKLALEGVTEEEAAARAGVDVQRLAAVVDRVVRAGVVLGPLPGLRRSPDGFPLPADAPEEMVVSHHFTLQWHLTNACDLRCRHCYDRARIDRLPLGDMQRIVEDFADFCRRRRIWGDFCLTGGNPLLYPSFLDLYRTIAATELSVSFLGNPAPRERMQEIVAIRKPRQYQVSLEGLEAHTDHIRGRGHFARVMEFLPVLRDLGIPSGVMLTLTRDNMDQVIALGEKLDGIADSLTFNRLAQVGEGASLAIPSREEYAEFLRQYREAEQRIPVLEYKDNLFNILCHESGAPFTDGCTGFGCGAAFNFMAILPDGEAHACRKFPSPIGNVLQASIGEVYESDAAHRYRAGSSACRDCAIRLYCGGCMAVTHGAGLDPFEGLDPHCFMDER